MPLKRSDEGVWVLEENDSDKSSLDSSHPSYREALPKYLTALDSAFTRAKETSEFNFLLSIFAVRGIQDAGWNPYETSVRAIAVVLKLCRGDINEEAARHLALWLYGHIMEASEPYEFLANLIAVATGGRFIVERFPPRANGAPLSPQTKIAQLERQATDAEMRDVVIPMKESWDRDFRNAIFHADYSLHGSEVRTIRPSKRYEHDEVMTLVNRALAYHEAMSLLRKLHIESYQEPTIIPCDPEFSRSPTESAVVIVRRGYGATGLKDSWSPDQLRKGHIPYRLGRFTREEMKMLDANKGLALLPPRAAEPKE